MNLNLTPVLCIFPECHYVFIEALGPFMNTAPKAWQDLHTDLPKLKGVTFHGYMSLYKLHPEMIYRAGVIVDKKPEELPDGFSYCHFEGGRYSKFVLKGSYRNLPEACGKVFDKVKELQINVRDGFYIENYMNDPRNTPEAELKTEILIPTV